MRITEQALLTMAAGQCKQAHALATQLALMADSQRRASGDVAAVLRHVSDALTSSNNTDGAQRSGEPAPSGNEASRREGLGARRR